MRKIKDHLRDAIQCANKEEWGLPNLLNLKPMEYTELNLNGLEFISGGITYTVRYPSKVSPDYVDLTYGVGSEINQWVRTTEALNYFNKGGLYYDGIVKPKTSDGYPMF